MASKLARVVGSINRPKKKMGTGGLYAGNNPKPLTGGFGPGTNAGPARVAPPVQMANPPATPITPPVTPPATPPATPPDTGPPKDSVYIAEEATAATKRGTGLGVVKLGEEEAGREYGYTDRTGDIEDNSNPFNRRKLLVTKYGQARNRTRGSYASQGQLYSGALANAEGSDAYTNLADVNTNIKNARGVFDELAGRRTTLGTNYETDVNTADAGNLTRALLKPPATPDPTFPNDPKKEGEFVKLKPEQQANYLKASKGTRNMPSPKDWMHKGVQTKPGGNLAPGAGKFNKEFSKLTGPHQAHYQQYLAAQAQSGKKAASPLYWLAVRNKLGGK